MSTGNTRFTAWLSDEERDAIRSLARDHGCSQNYIVRMAVRGLLGKSVPSYLKQEGTQNEARTAAR